MSESEKYPKPETGTTPSNDAKRDMGPVWLGLLALVLTIAYIVPGLTGHDPWTQASAQSFDIVHGMLETGDYIVPRVGDEPVLEKPPFYYMSAAGMAKLLERLLPTELALPAQDAARLATGLHLLILFGATLLLGRAAWRREGQATTGGAIALLVLLGTLGLLPSAHALSPEIALSAGLMIALFGAAIVPSGRGVVWAGIWLGTGAGLAFMSGGFYGLVVIAFTLLLLPLFPGWRDRRYLRALLVALVAALPWLAIWPTLLYLRDPGLFQLWAWDNNFGRLAGDYFRSAQLFPPRNAAFWLERVPWLTFPAIELALLALILNARAAFASPGVRVALLASLFGWTLLYFAPEISAAAALPLLAPLAVIAAGCIHRLPRWLTTLGYSLTVLAVGAIALLLWGLWAYHMHTGQPFQSPLLARYMPMDFDFVWQPFAYVFAAALSLGWVWLVSRFRPPRPAALLAWPAGVVLLWGLVATLHLPWIAAATGQDPIGEPDAALPLQQGGSPHASEPWSLAQDSPARSLEGASADIGWVGMSAIGSALAHPGSGVALAGSRRGS